MANIIDSSDRDRILKRLNAVTSDSPAQWGKMNAEQMICHLGDQILLALGEIVLPDKSSLRTRLMGWALLTFNLRIPEARAATAPAIDQVMGNGTQPTNLEDDRQAVIGLIDRFLACADPKPHALFGPMNQKQWGQLVYMHMDHHLRQFGC